MKTTIAQETKTGLEVVAKREKLSDHGLPSKGRAIDWLWNYYNETRIKR